MQMKELESKLSKNEQAFLARKRILVRGREGKYIVINNKRLINFASNDYLGLADHADVKQAFIQGAQQYGVGSGGSTLVSGYSYPHALLEEKIARFFQREKAVVLNSGYIANLSVIAALSNRNTTIIADKLNHISLLEAIRLSDAKHYRYPHNDNKRVQEYLSLSKQPVLLVTESIFSMEGDICPVNQLAKLSHQYQAMLVVDDAHGAGVLGMHGGGICEYQKLNQDKVPVLIVPFGKAFGTFGAAVVGKTCIIENIIQFAKPYGYTTALPPAICSATLVSLKILHNEPLRRNKLYQLIKLFICEANKRALKLISLDITPIKLIVINDNIVALQLQRHLMQNGFYTACIRPPTVPAGTARLRISINYTHEEDDIIHLLDLIAEFDLSKRVPRIHDAKPKTIM